MLPFRSPIPRSRQGKRVPKPVTKRRYARFGVKDIGMVKEDEYVVECVVGKKYIETADGQVAHYLIKWKGWGPSHNTWEPVSNLQGCIEMVNKYEAEKNGAPREDSSSVQDDDESDRASTLTDFQSREKARVEAVEFGVLTSWPSHMVPLEMKGVIEVDGRLCYVVKHQTENQDKVVCSENCVIVRAEIFRPLFPQIVIKHYEKVVVFVERKETPEQLAKLADEALEKKKENDEGREKKEEVIKEEEVVLDDVGLPIHKTENPGADKFGLPVNYSEAESSSDDEFSDDELDVPAPEPVQY